MGATVAGCGSIGYAAKIEPNWPVVERVTVPLKNLPAALAGLKIVQLSDIHLQPFTQIGEVRRAVQLANRLQPDLVVLTGDYVLESARTIDQLAPTLAGLASRLGTFAILGNHDLWTNEQVVSDGLESAGIPVLRNRGVPLNVDGAWLYLAGLDDVWSGDPNLDETLADAPDNGLTVLLAHEPDFADTVAAHNTPVRLQLSGHSHGGQVRLPGFGAPVLPRLGQKYDQGLNRAGDLFVYTSRGVGVVGPPIRFNCPPEVTEITLVPAEFS